MSTLLLFVIMRPGGWMDAVFSCTSAQALGGVGRVQEEAAWHMRARCWRGVTCARALAGLCAASRSEDSLGTAQLTEPSLGAAPALVPLLGVF